MMFQFEIKTSPSLRFDNNNNNDQEWGGEEGGGNKVCIEHDNFGHIVIRNTHLLLYQRVNRNTYKTY